MFLAQPFSAAPCGTPSRAVRADRGLRHHAAGDPMRARVERLIQSVFAAHFDARITAWAPHLVSLEHRGEIVAAAGYRSARQPLYLERYLAQPVEQALAAAAGIDVAREQIAEVGHLASVRAGSSPALMVALGHDLAASGFRWVVSTATRELRRIFARLGVRGLVLGAADPRRLGRAAADWGRYYEHAPLVLAVDIAANLARAEGAVRR